MRFRFFHKLFAFILVAVLVTGISMGIVLHRQTRALLSDEIAQRGRLVAQGLALNASKAVETGDAFGSLDKLVRNALQQRDVVSIQVIDGRGRPLANVLTPGGAQNPADRAERLEITAPVMPSGSGLVLDAPRNDEPVGLVRVGLSLERSRKSTREHALVTAFLVLLVTVLAAIPAAMFSRLLTRRIERLRDAAHRLGAGERGVLLPVGESDELGELGVGFNLMSDQLGRAHVTLEDRVAELKRALDSLTQAQEQVLQSGKMAAVGQLAAGIAHEINNPLAVILGFAQALDRRVGPQDALRLPVESIVRESQRCAAIVKELLTFSRTAKKTTEPLDANEVIRAAGLLLESRAKMQRVRVEYALCPIPIPLTANRTQLQQVLVNLGTNAMDAMPEGGVLTLRAAQDPLGARIDVTDTGTGIPEDVRARIFEPFFTTKEVGKGTGLGLSLVHEIVQQHGGSVDVASKLGAGTTLSVHLPRQS